LLRDALTTYGKDSDTSITRTIRKLN